MTNSTKLPQTGQQNPTANQSTINKTPNKRYQKMDMIRRLISVGVILQLLGNIGK